MQFLPNGGVLPWGGLWMRLQSMASPFAQGPAERASLEYEQGGKSYSYLLGVDSYLYARQALNVLDHGDVCDQRRGGACVDLHRSAPNGHAQRIDDALPYALAGLHRAARVVDPEIPAMESFGYFPVVVVALALVPAFFLGRRVGGNVGGFFAATVLALHEAFLGRTLWGLPDTDAPNVFLPLLSAWLFLSAFDARRPWARFGLAAGAGLVVGVFSLVWDGWWYCLGILAASGAIMLAFAPRRPTALGLGTFVVSSAVFVSVFRDPSTFFGALLAPLREVRSLDVAVEPSLWPNVLPSVGELERVGFLEVVGDIGPVALAIAVAGLAVSALTRRKDAVLFGLWLVAALVVSRKGVRFEMFAVPPLAVGLGAAIGLAYDRSRSYSRLLAAALVVLFGAFLVAAKIPADANATARLDLHKVDDAWSRALEAIERSSEPGAVVTSWWDPGHHIALLADRPVTFDPGSQNSPIAYWVGKLLLTDDEELSTGILRMLNCGGNRAFDATAAVTRDTVAAVRLLTRIIPLGRGEARGVLRAAGFAGGRADRVLRFTRCDPPQAFVVVYDDLWVRTAWAHYGSWSLARAAIVADLRHRPEPEALREMKRRFGLHEMEARRLYRGAKALRGEAAADAWIAPFPRYFAGPAQCRTKAGAVTCSTRLPVVAGSTLRLDPSLVVVAGADGTVSRRRRPGGNPALGAVLRDDGETSQALLASPVLAESMLTRLTFLSGRGLRRYRLLRRERTLAGRSVYVYEVDWTATRRPPGHPRGRR